MPIVFAAIAHKNGFVAEYPDDLPKLSDVCKRIVAQIPVNESRRKTYEEETYNFHLQSERETVCICCATKDVPMRINFNLLGSLHAEFKSSPKVSRRFVRERLEFHNDSSNDRLLNLQNGIDDVKTVMQENIERVLERGEKLENLTDRSSALADDAEQFNKTAKKLKSKMWLKNVKMMLILGLVCVFLVVVVLMVACNPNFSKCS